MSMKHTVAVLVLLVGGLLSQNALAFYNPSTGRWLSRDPVQEKGDLPLVAYCKNNPINRVDALGLWPREVWELRACQPCICRSVQITYNPGGQSLDLGWYTDDRGNEKYGNRIEVHWNVSGPRDKCRYFQDERETVGSIQGINPPSPPRTTVGTEREVPSDYIDQMGSPFGFNPGMGVFRVTIHWSVTFRCISEPKSGGVVARHDTFDIEKEFQSPPKY